MDQDDAVTDRGETGADTVRSLVAADDELADIAVPERFPGQSLLADADDHAHVVNARVACERIHRIGENRLPAKQPILLGYAAAHPAARSGGDDERGDRGRDGPHGPRLARLACLL